MPSFWQIGIRIGTSSVIAAVGSRKQPTNSSNRLASSRKTCGLLEKASTHSATASVTRVTVSSQPKIEAAATMNRTVAVVSIVSMVILIRRRQSSVRYQKRPRNSAHMEAAIAPSVGVNTPIGHAADQQHRREQRHHRREIEDLVEREQQAEDDDRGPAARRCRVPDQRLVVVARHEGSGFAREEIEVGALVGLQHVVEVELPVAPDRGGLGFLPLQFSLFAVSREETRRLQFPLRHVQFDHVAVLRPARARRQPPPREPCAGSRCRRRCRSCARPISAPCR